MVQHICDEYQHVVLSSIRGINGNQDEISLESPLQHNCQIKLTTLNNFKYI